MSSTGFNVVFLLHAALELPFSLQGLFQTLKLPFIELTNTTLVFLKLYASLSLATCVAAGLCYSLPDYLPGKRAFAIQLAVYHTIAATLLVQAPRFIPLTVGGWAERMGMTAELAWASLHASVALLTLAWWQATVGVTRAMGATAGIGEGRKTE